MLCDIVKAYPVSLKMYLVLEFSVLLFLYYDCYYYYFMNSVKVSPKVVHLPCSSWGEQFVSLKFGSAIQKQ